MNATQWIDLQVRLEYRLDPDGRLVPFSGSTEQARFTVYRHAGGWQCFYRFDLDPALRERLAGLPPELAFAAPARVQRILAPGRPAADYGIFRSYVFTHPPEAREYAAVSGVEGRCVVTVAGRPVCWAWSERQNETCAEAAVETLPEYRRRGYARQATAAWAAQVLHSGRVAFFSHAVHNTASQALARSLGVSHFADCASFD